MKNENWLPQQKKNTVGFLKTWEIHQQLFPRRNAGKKTASPKDTFRKECPLTPPRPFQPVVRAGEVRLLSQTEGFQYVAVLEQRDWNFLVVPYSRFSDPATDTELALERNGGAFLEVLQVWNARTIHISQLWKSWLAAELTEAELAEIRAVREHFLNGTPLPENIAPRTGCPISRADDPRLHYQLESHEVFADIDLRDLELLNELKELAQTKKQCSVPEFSLMAAAGENLRFSQILDAPDKDLPGILRALTRGQLPGTPLAQHAEKELRSGTNHLWHLPQWNRGSADVVFWSRQKNTLLALGILLLGHEGANVSCICGSSQLDKLPPSDIILLIGK